MLIKFIILKALYITLYLILDKFIIHLRFFLSWGVQDMGFLDQYCPLLLKRLSYNK